MGSRKSTEGKVSFCINKSFTERFTNNPFSSYAVSFGYRTSDFRLITSDCAALPRLIFRRDTVVVLGVIQQRVEAVGVEELLMGALLHDGALFHY